MGIFELPEGYAEIKRIHIQKDKKIAVLINLFSFAIAALLFPIGLAVTPIYFPSIMDNHFDLLILLLLLIGAMVLYVFGHEFVHGIFIKKYSGKKAKYGFTGLYAFAGSDAFFNKRQYLVIALSPVIIFGNIFLLLNIFLPIEWFWFIFLLQIINCSGAAGDLYITYLMRKLPDDVLSQDEGIEMVFYSRK